MRPKVNLVIFSVLMIVFLQISGCKAKEKPVEDPFASSENSIVTQAPEQTTVSATPVSTPIPTQKPRSAYLDSLPEIKSDESTEYTDNIINKVIKHDYQSVFAMFDPAVVEKNFNGDIKTGTDKLSESLGWINDSAIYKLTRHFAMSDKSSIKNTYTFIVDKNGGEGRVSVVVALKTVDGRMYLSGIQVTKE